MVKQTRKKRTRKKQVRPSWWLKPLSLAVLVIVSVSATFYFIFLHIPAPALYPGPTDPALQDAPAATATLPVPAYDPPQPDIIKPANDRPKIAIIIDDMGYHEKIGNKLLNLEINLSFAFLPFAPYTERQSLLAQQLGKDILLHLPMEPVNSKINPGPGALFISMNSKQLQQTFKKNLAAVPMAIGVNNHMGSRYTANRTAMQKVLKLIHSNNLFFLDSLTTSNSVAYEVAKEMGVTTIRRNVFLDNDKEKEKIMAQLDLLVRIAQKQGWAVGLGHSNQETLAALIEFQKQYQHQIELVRISALLR